jgi:hypothetical protein
MGPFKCPDCGVWWAGVEHGCAPTQVSTGTDEFLTPDSILRRPSGCTCPEAIPLLHESVSGASPCPLHPIRVTFQ